MRSFYLFPRLCNGHVSGQLLVLEKRMMYLLDLTLLKDTSCNLGGATSKNVGTQQLCSSNSWMAILVSTRRFRASCMYGAVSACIGLNVLCLYTMLVVLYTSACQSRRTVGGGNMNCARNISFQG